ncbi:MAG TPA: GNAT family N-acetyltransferase [Candidatus Sulfotelmatobacter sp.]|nr:GNAT family N-acetyltransferase [Candidatus Sulfotelmatobacter sp.]
MLRLAPLSTDAYVRDVLPHSAELWAGARSFDEYAAELRGIAGSAWGRRRFRTVGLWVGDELVASCKRYDRVLRCGDRRYRAAGIGAVFTPPALRGRGYATALLGALLDAERAAGTAFAYLFSDIGATFYEHLGFVKLPARAFSLRADGLAGPRVTVETLGADDDAAMRRVFAASEARRHFAFVRTPLEWEWQRLRAASREHGSPVLRLGVRRGRALAAYVVGRRIPTADVFALDELALARAQDAPLLGSLLRAAAGDLRKIGGWLPPAPLRGALPRGAVRPRRSSLTMVLPLDRTFAAAWRETLPRVEADAADPCWAADYL